MPAYVMVPVPEERVPDVMRLLVNGHKANALPEPAGPPPLLAGSTSAEPHPDGESWAEFAQMPDQDVGLAYRESWQDGRQRALWEFLAGHPDERFAFAEVCERLGWDRRQLPGTLGAYGRRSKHRYGGQRPHHIHQDEHGTWWMWMDKRVARIIREEAGG